jgi:hypothetical protein
LTLTFFPDRLAFAAPSPPDPIGTSELAAAAITVGAELVPTHAVVSYRGTGIGTGFAHVQLGQPVPPITLRPPATVRGRVGEPIGLWCFGWRSPGLRPVAGAEVVVMGGGEHGVALASGRTDADGNFVIDGVDGQLDGLGLRVRAPGFALATESIGRFAERPDHFAVIALDPGTAHAGQLVTPADIDPTKLRVVARGLPGVDATPAADGTFVVANIPRGMEPRVLVHGLPPTRTFAPARLQAGRRVRIEIVPGSIVRGRVLDAASQKPLSEALVWCGEQDPVRCDKHGRFELLRQMPGDVEIEAQWEFVDTRRRRTPWFGRQRVQLEPERAHDGIEILVTAR